VWTALVALAASLAAAGGAHAAGMKQVKDWIGVCANTGACTAVGFGAEEDATGAYLIVARDAGPGAAPKVTVVAGADDAQPAADWTFTVDDRPVAGLGAVHAQGSDAGARAQLTGRAAMALIAALRTGDQLAFAPRGKAGGDVSLAGSAAVLLWLDDQQGRVGTATALARPGPKPAASVPPPTALPLIAPAPAVDQKGVPAHAPRSMVKGLVACDLDPGVKPDDIVARLAPGLVLWGPECDSGAYNRMTVFFLGDEHGGHPRRVRFPVPPGAEGTDLGELINAEFDPKTQTMATFAKSRGIGDCGDVTDWVWDGKAFRVISQTTMPLCRGMLSDDWPVLFASRQK
jgi:hypothetical protein